jgi:cytochrome oxidase Cu insertion factor (SCO1/SenC/PrrC family)
MGTRGGVVRAAPSSGTGTARTILALGLAVLGASAPAAAHQSGPPARPDAGLTAAPPLPAIRPAPDFVLSDTAGRPVHLADFRGRVVLLSFIYTRCPDACPLLTAQLARLQARLGRERTRVQLLSITVDPQRDSVEELRAYARRFGADPAAWSFLRAPPERLGPVLQAYDEWTRSEPGGAIDHPARLYLIDAAGRIREIYALGFFDERQALLDIRVLLRETSAGR